MGFWQEKLRKVQILLPLCGDFLVSYLNLALINASSNYIFIDGNRRLFYLFSGMISCAKCG